MNDPSPREARTKKVLKCRREQVKKLKAEVKKLENIIKRMNGIAMAALGDLYGNK